MPFGAVDIAFDTSVLVPRPWTLAQSGWAAELLAGLPEGPVLELCSGAGQIGLAAVAGTGRVLVQVDRNPAACAFARRNAQAAGVDADVRCGGFDDELDTAERFAMVLADPPWVPTDEVEQFPEDPVWAIDGGSDGLDVARACLDVAARHLMDGGAVLLQVGSIKQMAILESELAADGLAVGEVRSFAGGAVALLTRPHEDQGDGR